MQRLAHLFHVKHFVDDRFHLVLRDNGVGIGEEVGGDKSGMGDILMRGFADQVSGTLMVDEAPGGGTRIQLEFDPGEPPERPEPADGTTKPVVFSAHSSF